MWLRVCGSRHSSLRGLSLDSRSLKFNASGWETQAGSLCYESGVVVGLYCVASSPVSVPLLLPNSPVSMPSRCSMVTYRLLSGVLFS